MSGRKIKPEELMPLTSQEEVGDKICRRCRIAVLKPGQRITPYLCYNCRRAEDPKRNYNRPIYSFLGNTEDD